MRRGITLIELLVALTIAAIVTEMAWNTFGQSTKQFVMRQKESDTLKTNWLAMRKHWAWGEEPDSVRKSGDSCLFPDTVADSSTSTMHLEK